MTATVLLRCAGPMQSWGTRSRFGNRDTEREPSKSGVLGLVAASLGRARDAALEDLAALRMCVRIDRAGQVMTDYQTALQVAKADGGTPDTVLSYRQYLADASFLVALEGDSTLCAAIHQALRKPRWPLFLGRKSHVPGQPIFVQDGFQESDAVAALRAVEWPDRGGIPVRQLHIVVECTSAEDGDTRLDVPISFVHHAREYSSRKVRRLILQPAESVVPKSKEGL